MGQVVYTGTTSGNKDITANGSDSVTVSLSRSGSFPSSDYHVTKATLYLSKFYCYSTSKGIDLYLKGVRVNDSEMCGDEVTEKVGSDGMSTSYYSISQTWDLDDDADYEDVTSAKIVSRKHSASTTGVMNIRDGCQVKITVTYEEGSGDGGDDPDDGEGGGSGGTVDTSYCKPAENLQLSAYKSYGESVTLTWEHPHQITKVESMHVHTESSADGKTWKDANVYPIPNVLNSHIVTSDRNKPLYTYAYEVYPPATLWSWHRFYIRTSYTDKTVSSAYSKPLQYVAPINLLDYTDVPLVAGETPVKAVHMIELQTNINMLRESQNLPAYEFSEIVSERTSLADWSTHVAELRTALDETDKTHDAWIALDINQPRADIIEQLRSAVSEENVEGDVEVPWEPTIPPAQPPEEEVTNN